jgi:hypothetical protein
MIPRDARFGVIPSYARDLLLLFYFKANPNE